MYKQILQWITGHKLSELIALSYTHIFCNVKRNKVPLSDLPVPGDKIKDIHSDYWKVLKGLVLSLITAGGVIKLEEVRQAHTSRLFQVRSLRGHLAIYHIPGICIVRHQIPLIGIIPLRGLLITSCRDLIRFPSHFVPKSFRTYFGNFVLIIWSLRTQ